MLAPPYVKVRNPILYLREIQEIKDKVMKLKTDANEDFNKSDYLSALNKYTIIVKLAEEIDFKEQLCILNSNKGLCFIKMVKYFINFFIYTN